MNAVRVSGLTFSYKVKKYSEGYIAVCSNIPTLDVYGKTLKEIEREMTKAIKGYFEAYPEEFNKYKPELTV